MIYSSCYEEVITIKSVIVLVRQKTSIAQTFSCCLNPVFDICRRAETKHLPFLGLFVFVGN